MDVERAAEKKEETLPPGRSLIVTLALLALAIFCFAVSSRSFWIDEAASVTKAIQTNPAAWWHEMNLEIGSDKQMPWYMFFLWAWEKIFGHSEWWIRAANLPWLMAGLFIFAGPRVERWIVVITSAFAWYCLDEARPYGMQLGASLAAFGSLERLAQIPMPTAPGRERLWLGVFLTSLLVLSGSSLLGMIWAGAGVAVYGGMCYSPRHRHRFLAHKYPWLGAGTLAGTLAIYYLWTIHAGVGASPINSTDWRNVLFAFAELLGFSGLGPGRLELRTGGVDALRPYLLSLGTMAVLYAFVAIAGLQHLRGRLTSRFGRYLVVVICGTTALLLALGVVKHFRVLGRHCTPLAPCLFYVLAEGISFLWRDRNFLKRAVVIAFLATNVASCLSLRLAARHAKDDYRGASASALKALAAGRVVWWNADARGGWIYGVPITGYGTPASAGAPRAESLRTFVFWNPTAEMLSKLPRPGLVIASKPDLFDRYGALAEFLRQQGYQPIDKKPTFTLWQPPEEAR